MNKESTNKRVKYGTTSIALVVIVIALFIILNVVFTTLSTSFSWYTDLTATSLYSITDEFKTEMNKLIYKDPENPVYLNIVIMMDEDIFEDYSGYTKYVYHTIKQIEKEYPTIKLISKNITKYPNLAQDYMLTSVSAVYSTDVAIELADKNHERLEGSTPKLYNINNFYTFTTSSSSQSSQVYGYNAEVAFLSAVARLVDYSEKPVAYYLLGHGEPTLEEEPQWSSLFEKAGYELRTINLRLEDFPFDSKESRNSDVLIINCPLFDLEALDLDDVTVDNEFTKIRKFLSSNHGNMIVFEDATSPELTSFNELLSEWGLSFGSTVIDNLHSPSSEGGFNIFAAQSDNNMASSFFSRISLASGNNPDFVFYHPISVNIGKASDMVIPTNTSIYGVNALITSYDSAVCGDYRGKVDLAGMGYIQWDAGSSERSYVIAIGSYNFVNETANYNQNVIYSALSLMNRNQTVSYEGISFKRFESNTLTVDTSEANTWTILTMTIVPVIAIGLGIFVVVRRKLR